jgi:hypothetical protein
VKTDRTVLRRLTLGPQTTPTLYAITDDGVAFLRAKALQKSR